MLSELGELVCYSRATAIVGDILKIRDAGVGLGDMAVVETPDGDLSMAQAIQLERDEVSLQVFSGGKGLSTQTTVRFLGQPLRSYAALADYWALTKPEVNFLIAVTTFAGFYLGCPTQSHG